MPLRKPSIWFSPYSNFACHYCSLCTNPTGLLPQRRGDRSPRRKRSQWRRFATVHSKDEFPEDSNLPPWPEVHPASSVPTPYQIFRLKRGAPYSKRRYYELAKIYHPDKNRCYDNHEDVNSHSWAIRMERYRLIVAAHEILSDPRKRSAYDVSGAGWNGRPEYGTPKYHWRQSRDTRWSGFDDNESPFGNATWEDWEKWYQRDQVKQEPVYFSNLGFLVLVVAAVMVGAFGQTVRVGDYSTNFQNQVAMVHSDASQAITKRRSESTGFGNRDKRLQNFLHSRDLQDNSNTIDFTTERHRGQSPKPEMDSTNTYLVGQGPSRFLIDTGEGKPSWSQLLSLTLASESATISDALITHWHPDHVGGIKDILSICPNAVIHKNNPSPGQMQIREGQIFKQVGTTLRAFHCPGHTKDHMAFVLEEESAMFTGDNVLGHGTAVFEDLAVYLDSLARMRDQFIARAYPGHGVMIEDGRAKICDYIAHRQQREEDILQALGTLDQEATPMEIVKLVYREVSEDLHGPAANGVVQVLRKLEVEGAVIRKGENRWQLNGRATL